MTRMVSSVNTKLTLLRLKISISKTLGRPCYGSYRYKAKLHCTDAIFTAHLAVAEVVKVTLCAEEAT